MHECASLAAAGVDSNVCGSSVFSLIICVCLMRYDALTRLDRWIVSAAHSQANDIEFRAQKCRISLKRWLSQTLIHTVSRFVLPFKHHLRFAARRYHRQPANMMTITAMMMTTSVAVAQTVAAPRRRMWNVITHYAIETTKLKNNAKRSQSSRHR